MDTATISHTFADGVTFSNPRLQAEFDDWPLGGSKRGRCVFQVENSKKGTRVSRTTTGKPKYTTYGGDAAIVDGSDGRTYILHFTNVYGFVTIYRSDFMQGREAVFPKDADFEGVMALIQAANSAEG